MLKLKRFFLWFILLVLSAMPIIGYGQNFTNPGLNSPIAITSTPTGWVEVPFTDPASLALNALQSFPDVVGLTGPGIISGINGNPHSGSSFVSGLLAELSASATYHEGIQQTVTGLNPSISYRIGFYQTVVKQDNCLDTSGRWAIYMDNVLLGNSIISTSQLPFNSNNLVWELDTITFTPTATTHTFKFLPVDDDAVALLSSTNLAGSLRMGIDSIHLIPLIACERTLNIGNDTTLCSGNSITLSVDVFSNFNYLWSNGDTDSITSISNPGTYSLQIDSSVCTYYDTIVITAPTSTSLGNDTTICSGDSIILDATTTGASYLWNTLSTDSVITITNQGQYYVDITTVNGCLFSDSIQVDYITIPTLNLGNDTTLCEGSSLYIDASTPSSTYLWNDLSTTSGTTINTPDTVSLILTQNTCHYYDTIIVDFYTALNQFLGADTSFCTGDSITLGANVLGSNYLWSNGSTDSMATFFIADTVWLAVTQNGCIYTDSLILTNYPIINFTLGNDTTICSGDSITLDATITGASYLWNTLSTDSVITITNQGQYYVDITTVNGCLFSDSIQVDYITIPTLNLGNDTTLCEGSSLYIDASTPSSTYLWNDLFTISGITINTPDTVSLILTQNTCHYYDTIIVDFYTALNQFLGADTSFCTGDSITLGANVLGSNYLWSNGSTDSMTTFFIADTTWLAVTQNGCIYTDSLILTNYPIINFTLGNDTTICSGDTVVVDATTFNASYIWNDLSTDSILKAVASGLYYVDININGCIYSDSIQINYIVPPLLNLGNDTTLCEGSSLYIDASTPSSTYLWNDLSTISGITINTPDTVSLILTQNTCHYYDTIIVDFYTALNQFLGADTSFCTGDSITLGANVLGSNYLWSNGSIDSMTTFFIADTTWLTVTQNGCTYTDSLILINYPIINFTLGNDTTICSGDSITLDATIFNASYIWNDLSTDSILKAITSGLYYVDINFNGCIYSDSIQINYTPPPSFNLGNDTTLCEGSSLYIDASTPTSTYLWSDLSTTSDITINTAGTVSLILTQNTCHYYDTIIVDYTYTFTPNLGNDTSLCAHDSITLSIPSYSSSILWSDSSQLSTLTVNNSAVIWVELNNEGCLTYDSITISNFNTTVIDLGNDTTLCVNQDIMWNIYQPGATYIWSDFTTNSNLTVSSGGLYHVQVIDSNYCYAYDTILIDEAFLYLDLGPDLLLCDGDSIKLNAHQQINANYQWQNNSDQSSIQVSTSGNYSVSVSTEHCQVTDSIYIDFVMISPLFNGNQALCEQEAVNFTNLSSITENDSIQSYDWNFGNGDYSELETPLYNYPSQGTYDVTLTVFSSNGCEKNLRQKDFITIYKKPLAKFSTELVNPDGIAPQYLLKSNSQFADFWIWNVDDTDISTNENTSHTYNQYANGYSYIELIVTSSDGCSDTSLKYMELNESTIIYVPNAFTPYNPGSLNNIFKPVFTSGFIENSYQLRIFDRWGELLFESFNHEFGWNGTYSGQNMPMNTYIWQIKYQEKSNSEAVTISGTITLIE